MCLRLSALPTGRILGGGGWLTALCIVPASALHFSNTLSVLVLVFLWFANNPRLSGSNKPETDQKQLKGSYTEE